MEKIIRIGMDTSKELFQLHGVNASEQIVLKKRVRRSQLLTFFAKLEPTVVGMEACGASHHWARQLAKLGHEVKLMAPQLAKPYVQRNKNDGRDAEALCEAMSRPRMRFVPVKTEAQQADLMLMSQRSRLTGERTRLTNHIRGCAGEFGVTVPKGQVNMAPLLAKIAEDATAPSSARKMFAEAGRELARLEMRVAAVDAKLMAWHCGNEQSRRLAEIPGVGPIGAAMLVMKTPDASLFRCGRDFAAWMGLTPKDHSTAGKTRIGVITRAGDEALRATLVVGANLRASAGAQRQRPRLAVAGGIVAEKAFQARRRGARQQERPHRLEAHGFGRAL